LVTAAGGDEAGKKLKAREPDWNGTDDYGFSALPGGSDVNNAGTSGWWWSATVPANYSATYAYYRSMYTGNDNVLESDTRKTAGFSVRCVKDD